MTRSARRCARRTRARWPACKAPMVGTSAIRSRRALHCASNRASAGKVRITCGRGNFEREEPLVMALQVLALQVLVLQVLVLQVLALQVLALQVLGVASLGVASLGVASLGVAGQTHTARFRRVLRG